MVQVSGSISLKLILVMYKPLKFIKIFNLIPILTCETSIGKPYNTTHHTVLYLIGLPNTYLMHSFMCLKKFKVRILHF